MTRYAYDFSRVPGPDAAEITANDGDGALTYGTGTPQPDVYLASLDTAGLHRALIWEHNTDSILGGYDYGVAECQAWEATHPPGLVYLACDLNDGALAGRSIVPFCQGWCSVTREPVVGGYGPDDAMAQVWGTVPKMGRWWGVVNWLQGGAPDNDPSNIARWTTLGASLVQLIGSPISGTDQNLILRDDWWTTSGATVNPDLEDDMASADFFATDPADRRYIWWFSGGGRRLVNYDEWQIILADRALRGLPAPKPFAGTPGMFAQVPDVTVHGTGPAAPTTVTSTVVSKLG